MNTWWLDTAETATKAETATSVTGTSIAPTVLSSNDSDHEWERRSISSGSGQRDRMNMNPVAARIQTMSKRDKRLIEWNANLLQDRLKKVLEQRNQDPVLPKKVKLQTLNLVTEIAASYNKNHFHNFEHCSHVTMSVSKLLGRVTKDDDNALTSKEKDYVNDISSSALTQFAVVLAAIIHDVDHSGVPNATLVAEKDPLALKYGNASVAENNSIDLAWHMIMKEEYSDFRACIGTTDDEIEGFHLMLENIVLATDICDKHLKAARDARWNAVFSESASANPNIDHDRATIVIEHLIQASDVCHTMQHWKIFRKWNERLFCEMYKAYVDGRSETNPADSWYKGEISFFDFYVIPLAKKLQSCGVFGVGSDEYLNYAKENRKEWVAQGQAVVAELVEKYCDKDFHPMPKMKKNGDRVLQPIPPVPSSKEYDYDADINNIAKRVRDRLARDRAQKHHGGFEDSFCQDGKIHNN